MDTFGTLRLAPGDVDVHKFPNHSSASSVLIKALSTNEGEVFIAENEEKLEEEGEGGYPLEKGEKISLEIKGTQQFFYRAEKEGDELVILFLAP